MSPLQIKIWNIPKQLLTRNLTTYRKELMGHARRVGLVEWHPTTANILFSAGYDYKVSRRLLYTGNRTPVLLEASLRALSTRKAQARCWQLTAYTGLGKCPSSPLHHPGLRFYLTAVCLRESLLPLTVRWRSLPHLLCPHVY